MGNENARMILSEGSSTTCSSCSSRRNTSFLVSNEELRSGLLTKDNFLVFLKLCKVKLQKSIEAKNSKLRKRLDRFLLSHSKNSLKDLPSSCFPEVAFICLENFKSQQEVMSESFNDLAFELNLERVLIEESYRKHHFDAEVTNAIENINRFEPAYKCQVEPKKLLKIMKFKLESLKFFLQEFWNFSDQDRLAAAFTAFNYSLSKRFGLNEVELNFAISNCRVPKNSSLCAEFAKVNSQISKACNLN